MRVELQQQQVLCPAIGSEPFLTLKKACYVVVVQKEAVDGALVNKGLAVGT